MGVGERPRNRKEIDLNSIPVSIYYRTVHFNVYRLASIRCNAARPCDGQAHSVYSPSPPHTHQPRCWSPGPDLDIWRTCCEVNGVWGQCLFQISHFVISDHLSAWRGSAGVSVPRDVRTAMLSKPAHFRSWKLLLFLCKNSTGDVSTVCCHDCSTHL